MVPVASSSNHTATSVRAVPLECEGLTNEAGIFLPVYPGHQAASQAASDESTQIAANCLTTPAFKMVTAAMKLKDTWSLEEKL